MLPALCCPICGASLSYIEIDTISHNTNHNESEYWIAHYTCGGISTYNYTDSQESDVMCPKAYYVMQDMLRNEASMHREINRLRQIYGDGKAVT